MDELIREIKQFSDLTSTFTLLDVAVVFGLSFVLSLVLGFVYRFTHRGVSYSQSFVHTLVVMCIVVAFLMLIIGSNLARAFTLVGPCRSSGSGTPLRRLGIWGLFSWPWP